MAIATTPQDLGDYKYGFHDEENNFFKSKRGLNTDIVKEISGMKNEPQWMRDFRLKSLQIFRAQADAEMGRRSIRHRLRRHLLLRATDGESGPHLGRGAGADQEHF